MQENVHNCKLISHFSLASGDFVPQVPWLIPHQVNPLHCKILGTPIPCCNLLIAIVGGQINVVELGLLSECMQAYR